MILITGGAGFIGSNLVAALRARNPSSKIVIVDKFGLDSKWRNLAKHRVWDIVEPDQLDHFLCKNSAAVEVIFHLGAISSTTEIDVDLIMKNNFKLSLYLWNWCSKNDTPLIYASSAATYGNGAEGFNDDLDSDALTALKPLNPYGWSKHLFDRWVTWAIENGQPCPPQWAGLKFFNVYGPNEGHKGHQSSLIAQLYPQLIKGKPARLFRSHREGISHGDQKRDFIWIEDCIDIMLWLYQNKQVSGIFNAGTGQARSFNDLANCIFSALALNPKITFIDIPNNIKDHYQYFTEASTHKIRKAGYKSKFTSLEMGVKKYILNYLSSTDQYK
ncbi:MAG: ADP-glyceromanno-heptose 6-epimerase [Rhodospirillaceae bacterium]|nr:ADP-glyceromanno-heptose 6-epimerase [Rhodospirillaceae bacterium]|tara:strand:+ start:160 stop:1149 length:990 start_codon:yes stop_codon:yes gene_type:complete